MVVARVVHSSAPSFRLSLAGDINSPVTSYADGGSKVRVLVRPPIFSMSYDGIAAKLGRIFHSGDTLGDTFCQGNLLRLEGPRNGRGRPKPATSWPRPAHPNFAPSIVPLAPLCLLQCPLLISWIASACGMPTAGGCLNSIGPSNFLA